MEPHSTAGPLRLRFSPYAFNGGTVLAIAGEDFSIVASDTRLSEGYSVHTRDSPKCYKLTDQTVIGCSGFHGDCLTLTKIIEARLKVDAFVTCLCYGKLITIHRLFEAYSRTVVQNSWRSSRLADETTAHSRNEMILLIQLYESSIM